MQFILKALSCVSLARFNGFRPTNLDREIMLQLFSEVRHVLCYCRADLSKTEYIRCTQNVNATKWSTQTKTFKAGSRLSYTWLTQVYF